MTKESLLFQFYAKEGLMVSSVNLLVKVVDDAEWRKEDERVENEKNTVLLEQKVTQSAQIPPMLLTYLR